MFHFNLPPGPEIGAALERVEEARSAGEIETKEQALKMAANTLRFPVEQAAPEIRRNGSD